MDRKGLILSFELRVSGLNPDSGYEFELFVETKPGTRNAKLK
jgi:hypothetical protein